MGKEERGGGKEYPTGGTCGNGVSPVKGGFVQSPASDTKVSSAACLHGVRFRPWVSI